MQVSNDDGFMKTVKHHPVFNGASAEEFSNLLERCSLNAYRINEKILYANSPRDGLLLILDGIAEVCVHTGMKDENEEVLEVLEPGEMIGFSSLADFLGEPPPDQGSVTVEVNALEPAVCLHIPYKVLEERWHDDEVRAYVLRQVAVRLREIYSSLAEQVKLANQWGESDPFIRRVQDLMKQPPLTVKEDATVTEAASKMIEADTSSILVVDDMGKLTGVITEKDMVRRVIKDKDGLFNGKTAADIATGSVITIHRHSFYYEAMSSFLINKIKHLPVTDEEGRPIGIVTLSDILLKKNRGQFSILQEIESSTEENLPEVKHAIYGVLHNLIQDGIPTLHTLDAVTTLYDRLVRHCVDLAVEEVTERFGTPPVPYAFFLMGSAGRGEQFLLTDQDHFLVYADPEVENKDDAESYFKELGEKITEWMEHAGYKLCDGDMMASFPAWRGTVSEWRKKVKTWGLRSTNDNILLAHNFMSFRFIHGNDKLHDQFTRMVNDQLQKSGVFLYRAVEEEKRRPVPSLEHPIRALFRMKKESIDIKMEVLFPFHHSLQILSAKNGAAEGTPKKRIEKLTDAGIFTSDFADDLLFAYEVILSIRVSQAWQAHLRNEKASGKIYFRHLKTREKEELMLAIKTIRALQNELFASYAMQ